VPSWAQWIAAFASTFTVVANILPFFLVMVFLITGVLIPYSQITVLWRFTMYWISPVTYLIGGVLSAVLKDVPVVCDPSEFIIFNPPPGQTCGIYSAEFLSHSLGYLANPNATSNCEYCTLSNAVGVSSSDDFADYSILQL
jgi:ATP-binding cassette, subfamily G (WHITE), member 2, SNQ2